VANPIQLLDSLLVNADYSLASSATSANGGVGGVLAVDPTGANLYVEGVIDSNQTPGITIYPANGSLQSVGSIAVPNLGVGSAVQRMVFTPDGTLAFLALCPAVGQGTIVSYHRASDGTLTSASSFAVATCAAAQGGMAVSADGRYLATAEVQIYSIAANGTLTTILPQPFTVTANGDNLQVNDLLWNASGGFLLASTVGSANRFDGGIGVLGFAAGALTETVTPPGGATGPLQQTGSYVYGMGICPYGHCLTTGIVGYSFQNGQLTALPGSPYPYGNAGDMVIY